MVFSMNWIDKLERKFGRFGIPNLMIYVIALSAIGEMIMLVRPELYEYLNLNVDQIIHHGQVWRLVTFLFSPSLIGGASNILLFALIAWVFYSIGSNLERLWGTFRFTLFYVMGVLLIIVSTFAAYFIMNAIGVQFRVDTGEVQLAVTNSALVGRYLASQVTLEYISESLFLAFAFAFPDAQFLLFFIIPIKAKWMSILYLVMDAYLIYASIAYGEYHTVVLIVASLLNLLLFFVHGKGRPSVAGRVKQKKRKMEFQRKYEQGSATGYENGAKHRCAICGRTEKDAPHLDFRYCSKCEGNYEYCSEHLFTHEHVRH